MQDIVVYISLDTAAQEKPTLLPLILSFEGESAYKEYSSCGSRRGGFPCVRFPDGAGGQGPVPSGQAGELSWPVKKVAVYGVASDAQPSAVTAALGTLRETQDEWYFLLPTAANTAMISALSAWCSGTVLSLAQLEAGQVEAEKLLIVQTADKAAVTTALKGNRQTVVCYNHDSC